MGTEQTGLSVRGTIPSGRCLAALVVPLVMSLSSGAGAASVCGSGTHWVDVCAAGTHTVALALEFGIDWNLDGITDEDAHFQGTMVVRNGAPFESDPTGDPGHLRYISTSILDMSLTGVTSNVAGWTFLAGTRQGLAATNGSIQEDGANPSLASTRYDMVFEIGGTPFGTLHHDNTFFFADTIESFPQLGADYQHLGGPFGTNFKLYDASGTHALTMTDLLASDHASVGRPHFTITAIVPVPPAIWLFGSGLAALVTLAGRQRRR